MKIVRWCAIVLMLLCLLVLVPTGSYAEEDVSHVNGAIVPIALDAKKAPAPYDWGFLSDTEYADPSIHVTIGKGRMFDNEYMYARIKIADPSQIRTAMAGTSINSSAESAAVALAKRVQAVVAINGDFFNEGGKKLGYVVRQGKEYRKNCKAYNPKNSDSYFDVLIIDDQGDFHILQKASNADVNAFPGKIVNALTFGPGLVVDGVKQTDFVDMNNGIYKGGKLVRARRMVLAQVGPLEYLIITSNGPEDPPDKKGLTMPELAELAASFEGVQNAYVLDGGTSGQLVFQQQGKKGLEYVKINAVKNPKVRPLRDIVYFASAFAAE